LRASGCKVTSSGFSRTYAGRASGFAGKTIVVVLPDSGARYLSGALCEGLFNAAGLA
jgi:cysteine synthase